MAADQTAEPKIVELDNSNTDYWRYNTTDGGVTIWSVRGESLTVERALYLLAKAQKSLLEKQ